MLGNCCGLRGIISLRMSKMNATESRAVSAIETFSLRSNAIVEGVKRPVSSLNRMQLRTLHQ